MYVWDHKKNVRIPENSISTCSPDSDIFAQVALTLLCNITML